MSADAQPIWPKCGHKSGIVARALSPCTVARMLVGGANAPPGPGVAKPGTSVWRVPMSTRLEGLAWFVGVLSISAVLSYARDATGYRLWLLWAFPFGYLVVLWRWLLHPVVIVDDREISIRNWRGARVIPLVEVADVTRGFFGVVVTTTSGHRVTASVAQRPRLVRHGHTDMSYELGRLVVERSASARATAAELGQGSLCTGAGEVRAARPPA